MKHFEAIAVSVLFVFVSWTHLLGMVVSGTDEEIENNKFQEMREDLDKKFSELTSLVNQRKCDLDRKIDGLELEYNNKNIQIEKDKQALIRLKEHNAQELSQNSLIKIQGKFNDDIADKIQELTAELDKQLKLELTLHFHLKTLKDEIDRIDVQQSTSPLELTQFLGLFTSMLFLFFLVYVFVFVSRRDLNALSGKIEKGGKGEKGSDGPTGPAGRDGTTGLTGNKEIQVQRVKRVQTEGQEVEPKESKVGNPGRFSTNDDKENKKKKKRGGKERLINLLVTA